MKFFNLYILFITAFFLEASFVSAKDKKQPVSSLNMVQSVVGESSENISLITITLSNVLENKASVKLSEHGRYLQLDLADILAANPGSFYEANSPFLNKIALFETSNNSTALRVFSDEDTAVLAKIAELDILENRIILSIDHKSVQDGLKSSTNSKTAKNFTQQLDELSNNQANKVNQQKTDLEAPISKSQEEIKTSIADFGKGGPAFDLTKNLRKVGIFMACLFLVLLFVLTLKRFRKNALLLQKTSEDALKTLGTLSLNPKQQLNLVEVGGEKILLSVSNESVSLISHIGQNDSNKTAALPPLSSPDKTERKLLASVQNTKAAGFPETLSALRKKALKIESSQKNLSPRKSRFDEAIEKGENFKPVTQNKPKTKRKSDVNTQAAGSKVSVAIGDEGVKNLKGGSVTQDDAIKDVTNLIRKKLKDLPKF